ncbi:MAG TPA: 3,4-dihydroxy-2-butanone-4-phosphate synthase [Haliangiales bacterium]|nr:3,4-dihydroxy-2-butanone-4-phosphate synthase [Haliangiales bacterium]
MTAAASGGTVRRVVSTGMPTRWGMCRVVGYEREVANGVRRVETAIAVVVGDPTAGGPPLVRIHSQCLTGEVLGSLRCDCNDQLEIAMRAIAVEGRGLLIYEHQEGRGIGLMAKLRAYALQDAGLDTVDANRALGFAADCRDFRLPAAILADLGIGRVRLLSNNPDKARALVEAGVDVVARVPCEATPNPHALAYLRTKKERMGHALSLPEPGDEELPFAPIDAALRELRAGRMIVVVDDGDREDEGDLVMAAEHATPEAVNFMAMHGRGLICVAMGGQRLDELDLAPMAPDNSALGGTAFTVSIDVKGDGVTTGISAHDRAHTIRAIVDGSRGPADFARPGHVFPLRSRAGGVLERRGHTEAAVDLASLAGLYPAGVICEIVNDDGTMARVPDLVRFCKTHDLLMITIADLARYRFDADPDGSFAAMDGFFPVAAHHPG